MHERRTRSFSEQECDLVTMLVCINLILQLRKSCSVHMTVFLKLLFITMLINGQNHWHDISGRKQFIYKLQANIGNSCIYIIALAASMRLKKMLCCKIIVNIVTFRLDK